MLAPEVIEVYVEGLNEPIGCTPRHPFWSVTRQQFIAADQLQVGEQLHTHSGRSAVVVSVNFPGTSAPVYNLEVQGQHVYRVSELGLLVHNASEATRRIQEVNESGTIPLSQNAVAPLRLLREGRLEFEVQTKAMAEEVLFRYFTDYRNTTGFAPSEARRIFGQSGHYHWDLETDHAFDKVSHWPGRKPLVGHQNDGVLHNYFPHLQIETPVESIRILIKELY